MISKALMNEKLHVYGKGMNIRDWLYVEAHREAIDVILHKSKKGNSYIKPPMEKGLLKMTIPDKPRSNKQKYRTVSNK